MRKLPRWLLLLAALVLVCAAGVVLGLKRYREYVARRYPARTVTAAPVTLSTLKRRSVPLDITVLGNVESTRRYFLYFKSAGRVAWVKPHPGDETLPIMPGDCVKEGEVLARLEDEVEQAKLRVSEAELLSAEAALNAALTQAEGDKKLAELARDRFKRYDDLFKKSTVSRQDRDNAERDYCKCETDRQTSLSNVELAKAQLDEAKAKLELARRQVNYTRLIAPRDGVIAYQHIREGDYFSPESLVQATDERTLLNLCPIVLIDPASLWVKAMLLPEQAEKVKPGVVVTLLADTDETVVLGSGELVCTQPARQIGTRMVEARIKVLKRTPQLVHGALVRCKFDVGEEVLLVAPRDVLVMRGGGYEAFKYDGKGRVQRCAVKVGRALPDGFEILGGASEGDRLVARGRYRLCDGQAVEVVEGAE